MSEFGLGGSYLEMHELFVAACTKRNESKLVGSDFIRRSEYDKSLDSEWLALSNLGDLSLSLNNWSLETLHRFNVEHLYQEMKERAPTLVSIREHLCLNSQEPKLTDEKKIRIAIIIVQLAFAHNPRQSFISGMLVLYLYACKVPKRVINFLNHVGLSTSHQTIINTVSAAASQVRQLLKKIGATGNAFQVSFDNVNIKSAIRDERALNQSSMVSLTAGFVLIPPPSRARSMFTSTDIDLRVVHKLKAWDFLPLPTDKENMISSFCVILERFVDSLCEGWSIPKKRLNFRMPPDKLERQAQDYDLAYI